jgi:hypothetical protein
MKKNERKVKEGHGPKREMGWAGKRKEKKNKWVVD